MSGRIGKNIVIIAVFAMLLSCLCACGDEETEQSGLKKMEAGMSMQVDESDGSMSIERPKIESPAPMGEDGTWTIFVYLCGSDLESRWLFGGAATDDIKEMCGAASSDKVRFVIETGGSDRWHSKKIDSDVIGRYVIEQGKLKAVDEKKQASMGRAKTLTDFLLWGIRTYPAEHMGVIFWDHGGGSIAGVCFDELADDDSLSLREIDASMLSCLQSGKLTDRFEFIGFDACLMGTVETTMSVIDLSKVNGLLKKFNTFAREMYTKSEKKTTLTKMTRKITAVDNFGGNNKAEGYTNMVDLGGLISACKGWSDGAKAAGKALDKAVVYRVSGSDHEKASGLSIYYPLSIQSSQELQVFESVCISPYYMSFVGRQGYGSVNDGETEDYDEDEEIFEGGFWNWLDSFLFDEETGDYYFDTEETDGDWEYFDDHEDGAQSSLITFEEGPGMDEEDYYSFVLDDEGYENTSDVLALVYQEMEDGTFVELGETYDVNVDWDTGYVSDNFDGYWLSLPDGQNLATYIVDVTDEYVIYTSPVLLNGEETNLRMRQYFDDGRVKVEGAWDGIDEWGASAKDIIKLRKGDKVAPLYYCIDEDGNDLDEYEGEPYTIKSEKGKLKIEYDYLYAGDYSYAFCITDIYGDDYVTDLISFNLSENGEISFYK